VDAPSNGSVKFNFFPIDDISGYLSKNRRIPSYLDDEA